MHKLFLISMVLIGILAGVSRFHPHISFAHQASSYPSQLLAAATDPNSDTDTTTTQTNTSDTTDASSEEKSEEKEASDKTESLEESPESTVSSDETKQKLKERIEKVVQERKDQIEETINRISREKRGFIGQVKRVSEETLTVENQKGTQILPIQEDITLLKSNKPITLDDVAVDNWVVVMGYMEDDSFIPKRILVSTKSLRPKQYKITLGSIESLSSSELTVVPRDESDSVSYTLKKSTQYQDLEGNKITLNDITTEMQALVIGYEDDGTVASLIRTLTVKIDDQTTL